MCIGYWGESGVDRWDKSTRRITTKMGSSEDGASGL